MVEFDHGIDYDPDLRHAEFISEAESLVYRWGDYVYKMYKWLNLDDALKYQRLTKAATEALNGVRMQFPSEGGVMIFTWEIVPILAVFTLERKACAVCPYIPGPTMADVPEYRELDPVSVHKEELQKHLNFTAYGLNRRLGTDKIDLNPWNMKAIETAPRRYTLAVTDLCSVIAGI